MLGILQPLKAIIFQRTEVRDVRIRDFAEYQALRRNIRKDTSRLNLSDGTV